MGFFALLTARGYVPPNGKAGVMECPFHDDKNPSLSVKDDGVGFFRCHAGSCEAKGNAAQFLMRLMPNARADIIDEELRRHGIPVKARSKPPPKEDRMNVAAMVKDGWAPYYYPAADGRPMGVVLRSPPKMGKKRFLQGRHGEYGWVSGGRWPQRRPYRAKNSPPDAVKVVIVEGEGVADALQEAFSKAGVWSWRGGAGAAAKTNWGELTGLHVIVWPDNDEPGLAAADKIAAAAAKAEAASVRLVRPPDGAAKGWDAKDALAEGGKDYALKLLRAAVAPEAPAEPRPAEGEVSFRDLILSNDHFRLLGAAGGDRHAFQIVSNGEIIVWPASSLNGSMQQAQLANSGWWLAALPHAESLDKKTRDSIGEALIRVSSQMPRWSAANAKGRGVHRLHDGDIAVHVGDKIQRADRGLTAIGAWPDEDVFVVQPKIEPLPAPADGGMRRLADLLRQYRFKTDADAAVFIGWLVCAVLGGWLFWRPHITLTGDVGSGKSFLINEVAGVLFGDWAIKPVGRYTSAGIARMIGNSSLPVLLDEAEARSRESVTLFNEIEAIMKIASDGKGYMLRASRKDEEGTIQSTPRCAIMLAGVNLPRLSPAVRSRATPCVLGEPTQTPEEWPEYEAAVEEALAEPGRLRSEIVSSADAIRAAIEQAEAAVRAIGGKRQREQNQIGALLGAAKWASGATIDTDAAKLLLRRAIDGGGSERETLVNILLSSKIRWSNNPRGEIAVGEAITNLLRAEAPAEDLDAAVQAFGIRVAAGEILVASGSADIRRAMANSPFAGADIQAALLDLPEAAPASGQRRINTILHRNVVVLSPLSLGLDTTEWT